MTRPVDHCIIWPDYPATGMWLPSIGRFCIDDSARAGGAYEISESAITIDSVNRLTDAEKARLTTWLVDQRLQGVEQPRITDEIVEYVKRKASLPIYERAERLLRFMARRSPTAGQPVSLSLYSDSSLARDSLGGTVYPDHPTSPIFFAAMAWSESTTTEEVKYFAKYLDEVGWAEEKFKRSSLFLLTVNGYNRIAEKVKNTDSTQAFVAMWFDDTVLDAYKQGIEPGIEDAGYRPLRIDQEQDVEKIDDAIIAGIRRSRFLVADFTQGEDGARGGVYFEAGFAYGLGIPVIHTCRKDMVDELAFDTRQYNHILWETPEELRDALAKRISARIGDGPLRQAANP